MNYDITTYEFDDMDLEAAVGEMDNRDRLMLILYLMGHRQADIAMRMKLTQGTICKRLSIITELLRRRLCGFSEI